MEMVGDGKIIAHVGYGNSYQGTSTYMGRHNSFPGVSTGHLEGKQTTRPSQLSKDSSLSFAQVSEA